MIKIVLDTNVLISAFIFGGHPRTILEHVIRGNIKLCIYEPILDEIKRVLNRPKFNYLPKIIQLILHELLLVSDFVIPLKKSDIVKSDQMEFSNRDVFLVFLPTILPVIGAIVILLINFSWAMIILLVLCIVIGFVSIIIMQRALICKNCKQGRIGCPAGAGQRFIKELQEE